MVSVVINMCRGVGGGFVGFVCAVLEGGSLLTILSTETGQWFALLGRGFGVGLGMGSDF